MPIVRPIIVAAIQNPSFENGRRTVCWEIPMMTLGTMPKTTARMTEIREEDIVKDEINI